METAIIIVLAFMLLIAIIISIDISFEIKRLNIKNQACASALDKSNNQNKYLRLNNDNLKKAIEKQEREYKEYKKYSMDSRDSKIYELETKYQSALKKIVERDEKIRLKDNEIFKYDKCNKQIAEQLRKKDNVIEDYYKTIKNLNQEKDFAIHQSKCAIKICNEMANKFKDINLELEAIQYQLKRKVKS